MLMNGFAGFTKAHIAQANTSVKTGKDNALIKRDLSLHGMINASANISLIGNLYIPFTTLTISSGPN